MRNIFLISLIALTLSFEAYSAPIATGVPPGAGGGGTVTSVSGTAPVVSSGGNTPAISCATCATTTNGGAISGTAPIAVSAAGVISGGGLGSVTGALKGNGSGTITQAACTDLSNGAASCSTDTTVYTNITGNGNISTTGTAATAAHNITSASANCLSAGPNGTTNPALNIACNTASAVTGVTITGAAAGAGIGVQATSTGASESIGILSKGNGTAFLNVPTNNNSLFLGPSSMTVSFAGSTAYTLASTKITTPPLQSGATKFTISGCSATTTVGGAMAGKFTSGTTGTCTVVITINGATGSTATNGWSCWANDETTPADKLQTTASSTTTATIAGTTVSGDVIDFGCIGF